MRIFRYLLGAVAILAALSCVNQKNNYAIKSPDGKLLLRVELGSKGQLVYSLTKDKQQLIAPSGLGLVFEGQSALQENLAVASSSTRSFANTWETVWGQRRFIEDKYDELVLDLQEKSGEGRSMQVTFRVFNDGIGFRYNVSAQQGVDSLILIDELTTFNLPAESDAWWIPAYKEKFYESLYRKTKISAMDTACTPLTIELDGGKYLAIHEANLTDYAAMNLFAETPYTLACDLTPWSTGEKVKAGKTMQSPWRIIIVADNPGELLTSTLMLNLNEPCKIEDTSWIKTGKYIGIWWAMHQEKYTWSQGPRHGATTENAKRYIDFAAANNFEGVLIEGWNYGWDEDWTVNGHLFSFTKAYPDFNLNEIAAYAKSKGVELIGHHETGGATKNYESQMEDAFRLYHKKGVGAVKTGYVSAKLDGKEFHSSQYGVRHYRKVIETAAKYHIMIDNHEPVMPTGLQRTYPNLITQEGVRGQEWDAWSTDGGNPPEHTTIVPFTRGLAGPIDFTFGTFNFDNPVLPDTRVRTTLAKQVALYMIIYSPWQMASDLPENYPQNAAFEFIKHVPTDWEDTRVIDAVIGEYVIIARKDRHSEKWYLGAITDEEERMLTIKLDFLKPATSYNTKIIADGSSADWKTNPLSFKSEETITNSNVKMTIHLAPGGGQAICFEPK